MWYCSIEAFSVLGCDSSFPISDKIARRHPPKVISPV